MANRSPNREATDVLVRQSQVRRRVRQILWSEYPGQASPAVVERVCAVVFARLGIDEPPPRRGGLR
jgi:hypothetical protein